MHGGPCATDACPATFATIVSAVSSGTGRSSFASSRFPNESLIGTDEKSLHPPPVATFLSLCGMTVATPPTPSSEAS